MAALGLFVGARLDQNSESTYIQRLNRRMLDELGSHWSTPLHAHAILQEARAEGVVKRLASTMGEYLQGTWFNLEYWGTVRGSRHRAPWGWKDPRNILLLPVYEEIFPSMRIVWVRRHPFDAARSLVTRESAREDHYEVVASGQARRDEARRAYQLIRGLPLASAAWRASSLRGAAEISLEYAELHESIVPKLQHEVLRLDYTDLVGSPLACTQRIARFLKVSDSSSAIETAAQIPQAASAGFRVDPELVALASGEFADRLAAVGYAS